MQASRFVETVEARQGFKIACLEEIAFRNGWIDSDHLHELAKPYGATPYGQYIKDLAVEECMV